MERVSLPLSEYSYEQKLDLLETLWDDLVNNDTEFKTPDWHEDILKNRAEALSTGKIKLSDWEEAKKRVRRNVLCK